MLHSVMSGLGEKHLIPVFHLFGSVSPTAGTI